MEKSTLERIVETLVYPKRIRLKVGWGRKGRDGRDARDGRNRHAAPGRKGPTDISNPRHFHKVVGLPVGSPKTITPVRNTFRLSPSVAMPAAFMLTWESNVFRAPRSRLRSPVRAACRRGGGREKPVAICTHQARRRDYKGRDRRVHDRDPEEQEPASLALIGAAR